MWGPNEGLLRGDISWNDRNDGGELTGSRQRQRSAALLMGSRKRGSVVLKALEMWRTAAS